MDGTQNFIQIIVDGLVVFATDLLMPTMFIFFGLGIVLRFLIYWTVKREAWFAKEFGKRVNTYIDESEDKHPISFFAVIKTLMEKTYYELFEVRAILRRRKADFVADPIDRAFMIQHGCAWLVKDSLKQAKYLKWGAEPRFLEMSKNIFQNNRCFNRVFGVIPASLFNDVLNILPGIFIIGGIFGTFLGIMKALPDLSSMDLTDVDGTKDVMNLFLLKISFSMSTSILGIILSVAMTVTNTLLSPEKLFVNTVGQFENTLTHLWNRSDSNDLPSNFEDFDEHKDPIEALAALSVQKEIARHSGDDKASSAIKINEEKARELEKMAAERRAVDDAKAQDTENKDKRVA